MSCNNKKADGTDTNKPKGCDGNTSVTEPTGNAQSACEAIKTNANVIYGKITEQALSGMSLSALFGNQTKTKNTITNVLGLKMSTD